MPMRSPALTGFKKMIFTGRSLGMFQMLVAIRFSARVTGGNADLRESFQVILMARYKAQTVKMLAPGIKPFPINKPKEVGRWVAVMGEEAVVFRAPLATDMEAITWATSGKQPPLSPWSERYSLSQGLRGSQSATLGNNAAPGVAGGSQGELPILEGEAVEISPKKLSEMVDDLHDTIDDSITLKVLKKAAGDPLSGFPGAVGGTPNLGWRYDPKAVEIWTRKRYAQRAITAARRGGK